MVSNLPLFLFSLMSLFSLAAFQIFLFLTGFKEFGCDLPRIMGFFFPPCLLYLDPLGFFRSVVLQFSIKFGKILVMISLSIFVFSASPSPLSLLSCGDSNYTYILLFQVVPQFTDALFSYFLVFVPFFFSFGTISVSASLSSLSFSSAVSNLFKPHPVYLF